jgi:hypothetical protein
MTSFEFFTVLLSFVVSLGVASLLQSVVRLIHEARRVQFSLAWALWAASIFWLQIIYWLRSWTYHEDYMLRTATSIPPLVLAIIAFLACGLATPRIPNAGPIDLRQFHDAQGRKYQIAYAVFMSFSIVQSALMTSNAMSLPGFWIDAASQAAIAIGCILCVIFHRVRWLQIAAPAVFLITAIAYYGRLMEG